MDIRNIFLLISTIFGLITPIVGIISILKGEYKPQRITRLVIFVSTLFLISTLYFQADRTEIYLAILQGLGSLAMLLLSIKYGVGGFSKFDITVFVLALTTMIIWKVTKDPFLAMYLLILADFIGYIPTIIKTYNYPHTEDWKFYLSDVFASGFNLLATQEFIFSKIAFTFYIFFINIFGTSLVLLRRKILDSKNNK